MSCKEPRIPLASVDKVFRKDGKLWLWGGAKENQHFDISEFRLKTKQLCHGIGREHFPALLEPQFESVEQADTLWSDDERVLVVKVKSDVRLYPRELVKRHEVVNDVVGGKPIFAAYCVLADLGAIYDRVMGGRMFTFAVNGYTYYAPNVWDCKNAFILWDRDTESLWWPPIGRAVSGVMVDTPLKLLGRSLWAQSSWGLVKDQYPQAKVLKAGQDFERPTSWPRLVVDELEDDKQTEEIIAPRWGENALLPR